MRDTISPIDGSVYCSIAEHSSQDVKNAIATAKNVLPDWSNLSIGERGKYITQFVKYIEDNKADIAKEITWQMGRPLSQSPGEIGGFADRANYMIAIAEESLKSYEVEDGVVSKRWVERVPLGIISVLSPWNYPFLTSVNAIIPALMSGNVVILKHSFQTPLVAEQYAQAAKRRTK